MKTTILIFIAVAAGLLKSTYDSNLSPSPGASFVSCTECPPDVRGFLNVPEGTKCDMINWELHVFDNGSYILNAEWKYIVDNRTDRKGGELLDSRGTWKVIRSNPGFKKSEIYQLTSKDRPDRQLSLLKLNSNLFQLMTKDGKVSAGGAGFANTLNRKDPVRDKSIAFTLASTDMTRKDMTLTGRTPLKPIDREMKIVDNEDHEKIKWMIKFYADGKLEVREVLEHVKDLKGTWTIEKGWGDNADAIVYKLNFEGLKLNLLKVSDDVFYFLTEEEGLIVGNSEFGPALIRRLPSAR